MYSKIQVTKNNPLIFLGIIEIFGSVAMFKANLPLADL
jgi:hypothetical protein